MSWVQFVAFVSIGWTTVLMGMWVFARLGVARATAAMLTLAVVVVEELYASARNPAEGALEAPALVSLGHQLHSTEIFRVSLLTLITLAAAPVLAALRAEKAFPVRYLLPVSGLVVGAALSGLAAGGIRSAEKAVIPPLLILAGMLVGKHVRDINHKSLSVALFAVMAFKAVIAILVTAGLGARGARFVLYYDAVTPSLAAAIVLAVFLRQHWSRLEVGLGLAATVVLLLSPRRTPVLALVVTGLLLAVLARRKRVLRRTVMTGAVITMCVAFSSALPENLRLRLQSGIAVLMGATHDDSAAGHFGDLYRGYELGITGPFFGLGPDSPQPSGLAANEAHTLYIHNEFLHVWVGRGILAALVLCALVLMSTIRAAWATPKASAGQASLAETVAVCFLLQLPVMLTFFPYLSTTTRWPLVYGIALVVAGGISPSAHSVPPSRDA